MVYVFSAFWKQMLLAPSSFDRNLQRLAEIRQTDFFDKKIGCFWVSKFMLITILYFSSALIKINKQVEIENNFKPPNIAEISLKQLGSIPYKPDEFGLFMYLTLGLTHLVWTLIGPSSLNECVGNCFFFLFLFAPQA